jgi:transposase
MSQYFIGVDMHKSVAQVCVLDSAGETVQERRLELRAALDDTALFDFLRPFAAQGRIAVEAVGCGRWFVRQARDLGMDVLVVHPPELELRRSGRKTDREDARELARRLRLGDLDKHAVSYFATDVEYARRKVTRIRHAQVKRRQESVSGVRAMLDAAGVREVPADLTTKKAIAWLQSLGVMDKVTTVGFQTLVADVVNLNTQIAVLDAEIDSWEQDEKLAGLVPTMPLAGIQTVATVHCELGDVFRFSGARAVAAFSGLAPRVAQSGTGKAHTGSITKRGSPELRWILSQWAVRLLAFNDTAKAWAKERRARGSNKLRIALARRLVVGVYHTMRTGEVFSLEKCLFGKNPPKAPPTTRPGRDQAA